MVFVVCGGNELWRTWRYEGVVRPHRLLLLLLYGGQGGHM